MSRDASKITAALTASALSSLASLEIRDHDSARMPLQATLTLFMVWAQPGGVRLKELKEFTRTSGANITGMVDRWVRLRYVTRKEDREDRRSYVVKVTPFLAQQFEAEFKRLAARPVSARLGAVV